MFVCLWILSVWKVMDGCMKFDVRYLYFAFYVWMDGWMVGRVVGWFYVISYIVYIHLVRMILESG